MMNIAKVSPQERGLYEVSRSPERDRLIQELKAKREARRTQRNMRKFSTGIPTIPHTTELPSALTTNMLTRSPHGEMARRNNLLVDELSKSMMS